MFRQMKFKRRYCHTRKLGSTACYGGTFHYPTSGYELVQDEILYYFWDVQRREQAMNFIEADKERKKHQTEDSSKEAALASGARHSLKIYKTHRLVDELNLLV